MKRLFKILIILPVALIAYSHYEGRYGPLLISADRKLYSIEYFLNVFPLFALILADWTKRNLTNIWGAVAQSSFYVYLYCVLSLTVFFIPLADMFRDFVNGQLTFNPFVRYNFTLFEKFAIYDITHRQVVGNFIMLLPLGIYLPLLYKPFRTGWKTILAAFTLSCMIELTQLLFSLTGAYGRTFDVDDILLNTLGAVVGYFCYWIGRQIFFRMKRKATNE